MSDSGKRNLAVVLLVLLTIAGLISVYQVCFDVWMTAYPYANPDIWKQRLWVRLSTTGAIGTFWILVISWLIRARRRRHSPNGRDV